MSHELFGLPLSSSFLESLQLLPLKIRIKLSFLRNYSKICFLLYWLGCRKPVIIQRLDSAILWSIRDNLIRISTMKVLNFGSGLKLLHFCFKVVFSEEYRMARIHSVLIQKQEMLGIGGKSGGCPHSYILVDFFRTFLIVCFLECIFLERQLLGLRPCSGSLGAL